jgi:hypothetical protein
VQAFGLIPYPARVLPKIHIMGGINRAQNRLSIRYVVNGEIENILLPALANPTRKHDLWKATCFEFFAAIKEQPGYWEFNLSPSSDWNVYAMDAYRQVNMREEIAFPQLPFEFKKTSEQYSLNISIDLNSILQPEQSLQIGITTIIQNKDGTESHWALAHPGAPTAQADFYLRESFVIEL